MVFSLGCKVCTDTVVGQTVEESDSSRVTFEPLEIHGIADDPLDHIAEGLLFTGFTWGFGRELDDGCHGGSFQASF